MLFILFYLILFLIVHITMTFVLCVACGMYVSSRIFFPPFLVNVLHFITALLITCQESFFFCLYRLYHYCHHHNHFIFFNTTSHRGIIQQMNSSGMVYPYPSITLGKPQGKYYFYFYYYYFFFVGYSLATVFEGLMPSFIFIT